MREARFFRVLSVLSVGGLVLSFALAWILEDPSPFVVVAPVAIGAKGFEAYAQRKAEGQREDPS